MSEKNTSQFELGGSKAELAGQPAVSEPVKISDVLGIALRFWYWVLISVILCTGVAVLYVLRTVPVYSRSCSVIIRDDAQGSVGASSVDLSDIGIGMSNTILEDEMAAIKSPDLMEQVVKKLHLDVSYRRLGTFHDDVLYGSNLPINVSFPDAAATDRASMKIIVSPEGLISVEDLNVNGRNLVVAGSGSLRFGSVINTPSGRIIIEKTPFFKQGKEQEYLVSRNTLRGSTEAFEGEISIAQSNKRSNVVEITCNDASVQRADEILTSLVNAYNQNWIRTRAEVVAVTSNFITDRLNSLETELGSVDSNISSYKSANMIPDLSSTSAMYMEQSSSAGKQIIDLNNQLQMARYLRNYISTEGKNAVLPVNTGIGAGNIESFIAQYNSLMIQRNSHLTNTSESNPLIIDLDSRLSALRASILSSLDNQILSLTTTIGNLERSAQSADARVAANPRQAQFLLTAERQQKVKETLYLYLLQKREENELSQAFTSVNTRILREPSGSFAPIAPKKGMIVGVGFLIGLLLPFAVIYFFEITNTKVRGKKDIKMLAAPVLGEIPQGLNPGMSRPMRFRSFAHLRERREKKGSDEIVVKSGERDLVNEAFRVLRTNLFLLTADHQPCAVAVTSFHPGSGKTFIVVNLGVAVALKDKKVLLIDGDMRRASLSTYVDSPRLGLADYLSGAERDIDRLIVKDSIVPGLSVLPVGHIPPNPTELLETKRFENLIDYLKQEYDLVLIDCPPMQMIADATIIDKSCDRTFFVVRVGLFERSMLPELDSLYKEELLNKLTVILNGVETSQRYGYSNRYGYGYSRAYSGRYSYSKSKKNAYY